MSGGPAADMSASATMPVLEATDLPYEEEILRNPYSVKAWLRYLDHKAAAPHTVRFSIYERAVKQLPGSYKLWYKYLVERRKATKGLSPTDPARRDVNHAFERALSFMHKMPRIWIDYLKYITAQRYVTSVRRAFDQALLSLPVTQHNRIWPLYLTFIKSHNIPETTVRVFRRHLQVDPDAAEEYIEYLISIGRLDDAAVKLADVVNSEKFASKKGRTNHQLWQWLCDLITKNPGKITSLRVDPIIRGGLRRFTDMKGTLWCSLADYYVRQGNFEKARDVYEEAIRTVSTVRDFSQVFDAYAQFEETSLSIALEKADDGGEDAMVDAEMRMARFEALMDRRPLLLSSVMLRQNPHNVDEWHKRVALYEGSPEKMVKCYTEAVKTIDNAQAVGRPHTLWLAFARMYEDAGSLGEARTVLDRAIEQPFARVEDLVAIWDGYIMMELRHENTKRAMHLVQQAVAVPKGAGVTTGYQDGKLTPQMRVHKSLKLWLLYADLQENLGTFETTKAVYDQIFDLRIATPQVVLNYAQFLEERKYFELAFTAYERGIALFKWPIVFEIWDVYLVKFIKRYAGTKIERTRELFEQALDGISDKYAKHVYLLYANFEEKYGLARHAMKVYERATAAVPKAERHEIWKLYILRVSAIFGVTVTRDLYVKAIEVLPDKAAREMCLEFADLERKLGEIDRARGVYAHCSQLCDPRTEPKFWKTWNDFELRHGNEDTFREMLRVKRSVGASYNTEVSFAASMAVGAAAEAADAGDDMAALEAEANEIVKKKVKAGQFVKAGGAEEYQPKTANADEIDIDDDSDDEATVQATDAIDIDAATRAVPDSVFGGLAAQADAESKDQEPSGAKARFAAAKQT
eukprot:m.51348 g.51348  ORF g.51348 m.51348 type:complete len:862 (+) comp7299_c0_seq1:235-2820(+)